MVEGAGAPRPDDEIVVDADRDRLCVAKAVRRRVAAAARVVVVQSLNGIEPELAADVGELPIDAPAEARLELLGYSAGESQRGEIRDQGGIDVGWSFLRTDCERRLEGARRPGVPTAEQHACEQERAETECWRVVHE